MHRKLRSTNKCLIFFIISIEILLTKLNNNTRDPDVYRPTAVEMKNVFWLTE